MKKFICIHGHFYQPPRENAWLETIEQQESAKPFHDWNERISVECYGPNGASRILNSEHKIINIVNNYANISFNFGSTLLSWMESYDKETYKNILDADFMSRAVHRGHGNAIAQVFSHLIMPLASFRDKETQIIWGIEDFKKRFKRDPEGMWLAETAVDTETLELLAKHQIAFTILAPRQAASIKKIHGNNWQDISSEEALNTKEPYLCKLPSGKSIVIFFYNGSISRSVAFNGLLNSGKMFLQELLDAFDKKEDAPQLVHVATDGETYGHHHHHGDMALASCLEELQKNDEIVLTNYAEYLEMVPPSYEVRIAENTSWSCVHGVERWRSDCGCKDGAHINFHQKWRKPLREALNWLRDQLVVLFEKELAAYTPDPWELRNKYIQLIIDRSETAHAHFFATCLPNIRDSSVHLKIIRMLEMQRHSLLMFTSCGWFFDEVSRIETKQILQYADRAIQIAEQDTEIKLYDTFLSCLREAPSNVPKYRNAAGLHEKEIAPHRLTLTGIGMHYAVMSLFEEFSEQRPLFNYKIKDIFLENFEAGVQKLAIGKILITSRITFSEKEVHFAVLYLGQHHIIGGFSDPLDADTFEEMYLNIREAFRESRITDVITSIPAVFGTNTFSFLNLFKDEQRKIMNIIFEKDISLAEEAYKNIYDRNYDLMNIMQLEKIPIPDILAKNLEAVINTEIKNFFEQDKPKPEKLEKLVAEALKWKIELDKETIGFSAAVKLLEMVTHFSMRPGDLSLLDSISRILIKLNELQLKFHLWKVQNVYFKTGKEYIGNGPFIEMVGEDNYQKWVLKYRSVGEQLNIRV